MKKILLEQSAASCRIRHDPIPAAFGGLGTNAKHAVGWINIVGTESAKFLSPQGRIVGKGEHRAIADRLPTCGGQNRKPVCFVGNPRQPPIAADEASSAARYHWVLATKTFIDKMAVEKPEYGYSLLNGCIRDRATVGLHGCEIRADVSACHGRNRQLLVGEKAKETLKSSGIGFERVATEAPLRLKSQPRATERVGGGKGDMFPTNTLNDKGDGQRTSCSKHPDSAR